jgi:hypothetical protein
MPERLVETCKYCGSPVRWVKTRKKKNMPIDDEPSSAGRFVIESGDEKPTRVRYLPSGEEYDGERFTSHFDTCDHPQRGRR